MAFIKKLAQVEPPQTYAVLAKDGYDASRHLIMVAQNKCTNPLFIVVGNDIRAYTDAGIEMIVNITDVDTTGDMLLALPKEIADNNVDGIFIDDIARLRYLWNAREAMIAEAKHGGMTTQAMYGITNNRMLNTLSSLSAMTNTFGATIGLIEDEISGDWHLALSNNLTNLVLMFFSNVHYAEGKMVRNPDTNEMVYKSAFQTDRTLALQFRLPTTSNNNR